MHSLVSGGRVTSPKGFVFHVVANHGGRRVTVVKAVEIRNSSEWTLVGSVPLKNILGLNPGDIVRHIPSGDSFIITMGHSSTEFGTYATGVASDEITESNRMAWKLFTEV